MTKINSKPNFRLRFEDWEGTLSDDLSQREKQEYEEHVARNMLIGDTKEVTLSELKVGSKREFVSSQSDPEFEDENKKSIQCSEVNKSQGSYDDQIAKVLSRANSLSKEDRDWFVAENTGCVDYLHKTINLKGLLLDDWIGLIACMKKSVAPLVRMLDTSYKGIAYGSPVLSERGFTTINQIARMAEYEEQKRALINIYVLNKMWAGLLKNDKEREVFVSLIQRNRKISYENRNQVRMAYRLRESVIKRIREFCLVKGYDAEWFYNHFGQCGVVRNMSDMEESVF